MSPSTAHNYGVMIMTQPMNLHCHASVSFLFDATGRGQVVREAQGFQLQDVPVEENTGKDGLGEGRRLPTWHDHSGRMPSRF